MALLQQIEVVLAVVVAAQTSVANPLKPHPPTDSDIGDLFATTYLKLYPNHR